jgi:hypothetical protein
VWSALSKIIITGIRVKKFALNKTSRTFLTEDFCAKIKLDMDKPFSLFFLLTMQLGMIQ